MPKGTPKPVDWASTERDYRAGVKTLRGIAAEHGGSPAGILKRARKEGWTRDLAERIKVRTQEKVNRAAARKTENRDSVSDNVMVEAVSNLQSEILLSHQELSRDGLTVIGGLFKELGAASQGELQAALAVILDEKVDGTTSGPGKTALYKAFDAAMSLGGRSSAARNISGALATLIDKQRQASGIDKEGTDRKSLGEFLESLP